jgi:hypothetical protein
MLTTIIEYKLCQAPAIWGTEIRRTAVLSQTGQIVPKTLSKKYLPYTKKGLVE